MQKKISFKWRKDRDINALSAEHSGIIVCLCRNCLKSKSYVVLLHIMGCGWYVIHARSRYTAGLKMKWGFIFRQGKENNRMWGRSG